MFNNDSLTSLISNMGNPNRDKLASTTFGSSTLTEVEITNAYSTNWMAKRLVNIPAKDALRNWRLWQADGNKITEIENHERDLGLKGKLLECFTKARVLGGAAIFIGTDDKEIEKELNPEKIKKGGLKYLTVMPKSSLIAGELETDVLSDNYGKPKNYEVVSNGNIIKIHPSRLVILVGDKHLDNWSVNGTSRGWGESIIQSSYASLKNSASSDHNVAGLIFEANIDIFSIPDLMSNLDGGEDERNLLKRFALASAQKGIHGSLFMDKDEEFDRKGASFGGLEGIMRYFASIVGATQGIPASKFLGQQPSGLNSTGEAELDNYYADIATMQELDIQPALKVLDECLIRSALGSRPEEIHYLWSPLNNPKPLEIAETAEKLTNAIKTISETNIYEDKELRTVATTQLVNFDIFPNLGDEIEKSDKELGTNLGLNEDDEV